MNANTTYTMVKYIPNHASNLFNDTRNDTNYDLC